MSKKIAVILSGCGVNDGAEIHESVLTLLAIDKAGASYQCFAPNIEQMHVVNHLTGEEADERRNVLVEAARIARGNIKDLANFDQNEFDAVILPGGFGAAKNLCDFAVKGADMQVQADVKAALGSVKAADKPIGALCISPVILAQLFSGSVVTIGSDADVAAAIEGPFGSQHTVTTHGEIVIDEAQKLVTTPCYMLDASIGQIAEGAEKLVKAVLQMA